MIPPRKRRREKRKAILRGKWTSAIRASKGPLGKKVSSRLPPSGRGGLPREHGAPRPHEPPPGPGPPRLDPRVRPGVLLDPEEEREPEEEHGPDDEAVEGPLGARLLHAERGVGQEPVDPEDREVHVPAAPRRDARVRVRLVPGGLPLCLREVAAGLHLE